jgi:secreted PhoX family phosphatase
VIDLIDETVDSDAEFRTTYGKGEAVPFNLAEVDWNQSGADQNVDAASAGLSLNRVEDGAFDPNNPNDYYFLTTEGAPYTGRDGGGLWRASFVDVDRPELGGTLELVLDGSEAPYLNKPDNMTIDSAGNLLIQEDPGNNPHLARIVSYRRSDGATAVLAEFDAAQFTTGAAGFITADEESSGIIDTSDLLGDGTFLFDAQVHAPTVNNTVEYVQQGQLLTMTVTDWDTVYSD